MEMRAKLSCFSQHTQRALLFFLLYLRLSAGQTTAGYTCSDDLSIYPCRTYVYFHATPPNLLSLPAIADLFNVSPLMISMASNLSSSTAPLLPHQSLLIPVTCSCGSNHSYANLSYQIKPGDTFYILSTMVFQNLTTYQAIELANPELVPTLLQIGTDVVVPVFCRCANKTLLVKEVNYFITYVIQPSDDVSSIAKRFGSDEGLLVSTNGGKANKFSPYKTILVPVEAIPRFTQPVVSAPSPEHSKEGEVKGLAVALVIVSVVCMVLAGGVAWYRWPNCLRCRLRGKVGNGKEEELVGGGIVSLPRESFMADVSDCLDKYKVFGIEELRKATMGFDDEFVIGGTVYKGSLRGEVYAVKLLKWNACEELKILQKVRIRRHSKLLHS